MRRLNILLADDDEDDRLFFREAIDQLKARTNIILVKNGVELMDFLSNSENILPDIIFLDLNMPLKGGMDCLTEIRSNSRLKTLSVAIYSTSSAEEDIENTFVKGANVYIKKPSDFESLKTVLQRVITTNLQYEVSGLNKENFLLVV